MNRNSKKDPEMIAAVDKCLELLKVSETLVAVAMDDYLIDPWWIDSPKQGAPNVRNDFHYPHPYGEITNFIPPEAYDQQKYKGGSYNVLRMPIDKATGVEFHTMLIWAFRRQLETGWTEWRSKSVTNEKVQINPKSESPRVYLDRIRRDFRNMHDLTQETSFTKAFALMQFKKHRYETEDTLAKVVKGQALPKVQHWRITTLKADDPRMKPLIKEAAESFKTLRDAAARALLPKVLAEHEKKFLIWAQAQGGMVSHTATNQFLEKHSLPGSGQLPSVLKVFAEKNGKPGTKALWQIMPEAFELLKK